MKFECFRATEELAQVAADAIVAAVREKPDLLLCVPTGSSPTRTYAHLAARAAADPALFRRLRVIALDEWGGLEAANPASCAAYLRQHVIGPLAVAPDRALLWQGRPADPRVECARVAHWLEAQGPIDFGLLGLGVNGHLGLNEPADAHPAGPHVAVLAPSSRQHAMLRATTIAPSFGLTLGLSDLLRARRLCLLVAGETKRDALARLQEPAVGGKFPASFLWLHPDVRVLVSADALPAAQR